MSVNEEQPQTQYQSDAPRLAPWVRPELHRLDAGAAENVAGAGGDNTVFS
ncbi:MAG TPA: hypothetical protein VH331_04705 [Allosphingosinicella sp.]|jgi:hypothetical protein|nr:hypothetical protein [Allosphingosinicella sp.]